MFNQHCLLCDYLGIATKDVLTRYLGFTAGYSVYTTV